MIDKHVDSKDPRTHRVVEEEDHSEVTYILYRYIYIYLYIYIYTHIYIYIHTYHGHIYCHVGPWYLKIHYFSFAAHIVFCCFCILDSCPFSAGFPIELQQKIGRLMDLHILNCGWCMILFFSPSFLCNVQRIIVIPMNNSTIIPIISHSTSHGNSNES